MAQYWVRGQYEHIDVLECAEEDLRRGFAEDAPTLGMLRTHSHSSSAHILFTRPLLVGTSFRSLHNSETAEFHPLSPTFPHPTSCRLLAHDETVDYAILQCEDIPGAAFRLKAAFPALTHKPSTHFLSYNSEKKEKVVGVGEPGQGDVGGYCTDQVGENHITEVITSVGKVNVGDPRMFKLLDTHIWPLSCLYFRNMKRHYFTYLRQYEVDNDLVPAGNDNRTDVRNYHGTKELLIMSALRNSVINVKEWIQRHFLDAPK